MPLSRPYCDVLTIWLQNWGTFDADDLEHIPLRWQVIFFIITVSLTCFIGHGAANVTLGIPRLREIVMTASQKPKTPSMTIDVVPGVSDSDMTTFCKRASKLVLSQIIDKVTVKECLSVQGDARRTEFSVDLTFYPEEEYIEEYDVSVVEILAVFGARFPLTLKREIQLEMKKLDADLRSQISQLGKGKASKEPVARETDADADEEEAVEKVAGVESEQDDVDGDNAKRARQRKEQASYESDEEIEEEFDDAAIEAVYASEGEDEAEAKEASGQTPDLREQVKVIADKFVDSFHQASNFKFSESVCSFKLEVSILVGHHNWLSFDQPTI